MWVLIVNSGGSNHHIDFPGFVAMVKAAFADMHCHDVKFMVKKASHLRPWLFQQGSEFSDPVSVTRFDRLDFVFMYGDPKLLPWSKAARQARILLRMCYNTGKATFCAGFGGQLLAYVSATGSRELHVVNGGGNGGDLEDITRCPVPTVDDRDPLVSSTPVFLDHATGDAFRYDRGRDVWAPFANMGLVKRDAAVTRGQYRPKEAHKLVEQVFTAKRHDETCRVGPACLHHWSVQGLGREFVVPVWGRWRLGVQSIRVRVPSFAVLGEAPWGALMFEVSNLLGVLFDVTAKNRHTRRILTNFIKHKYQLMQQFEHIDNSSAMLLPNHPRDSKGNPIVPELKFGPNSAVRTAGEAMETPRDPNEQPSKPVAPADMPAFNTYHSTRLRVARSSASRRPTSATTRVMYRPASPREGEARAATAGWPGGRSRPVSARPVLSSTREGALRVAASFTGGSRQYGAPVGRAGAHDRRGSQSSAVSPRSTSPRWQTAGYTPSDSRLTSSLLPEADPHSHSGATLRGHGGGSGGASSSRGGKKVPYSRQLRRRPASATAQLSRAHAGPAYAPHPGGAPVGPVGNHNRTEYRPRRTAHSRRPHSSQPTPSERRRQANRSEAGQEYTNEDGSQRDRDYDHRHDHPRTKAAAAAAARGAAISPRGETNPLSPRGHTADKIAEYAFSRRSRRGSASGQEAGDGGVGEPRAGSRSSAASGGPASKADGAPRAASTPKPPPAPKRVVIKYKRRPFSTYKKYKKMSDHDKERGTRFVSVRSDGTPFMSDADMRLKEHNESRKKWLAGDFRATFGKATEASKPRTKLITAQTQYYPPGLHKFRDEDKTKFVGGRDFIVA